MRKPKQYDEEEVVWVSFRPYFCAFSTADFACHAVVAPGASFRVTGEREEAVVSIPIRSIITFVEFFLMIALCSAAVGVVLALLLSSHFSMHGLLTNGIAPINPEPFVLPTHAG